MQENRIVRRETVSDSLAGLRLDRAAADLFPEFSRSRLQLWIKGGNLTVNSQNMKQKDRLQAGDVIEIDAELEIDDELTAEAMELDVRYEDEHFLIVNKPENLVVHPAAGHHEGTLLNGLLHSFPELAQLPRAGIIHRLDKDTTGLMLIARTLRAHTELVRQLQERRIERVYQALVHGVLTAGGTVDQPVGRHPVHRTRMAVVGEGKPARTHYRVLERFSAHTHVEISLETGRTHQIRVHMAWLGYPVLGDRTYGGRPKPPAAFPPELTAALGAFGRQALHACKLSLMHPANKEKISVDMKLPPDMQNLLELLRQNPRTQGAADAGA
ncbi:MAG: 23S rRNA pseudouridine(1911/1915/1917) synthase RluD [Gammaproteobacteria bacterium]|nr:23S rRNA pseudouridine(1911/1915/1917) synthase RluD [Gammaproteobacteria bacterium]MYC59286.1 23S rRNA pseudouridine(1911/1915/1917) synthase RluD [Gammaproteobacteria bacterium]MYH84457.1 23S rRNA pseudouridine(1911/1915/1917) synthase RluD [Gammaproteobacteria bacterium]MYK05485.1 23S rRNA pseudouridine(1911/1915/1917) synthase RluD [Gammaproteobacteria bacterium]